MILWADNYSNEPEEEGPEMEVLPNIQPELAAEEADALNENQTGYGPTELLRMRSAQKQMAYGVSQIIMMRRGAQDTAEEGSIRDLFSACCPAPVPEEERSAQMKGGGKRAQFEGRGKRTADTAASTAEDDPDRLPQPLAHSWEEEGVRLHLDSPQECFEGRVSEEECSEGRVSEDRALYSPEQSQLLSAEFAAKRKEAEVRREEQELQELRGTSPIDRIVPSFLCEQERAAKVEHKEFARKVHAGLRGCKIQEVFAEYDKDGSGHIDKGELDQAMTAMGMRLTQSELHHVMYLLDFEGDGEISAESFTHFVENGIDSNSSAVPCFPPILLTGGTASPINEAWKPARVKDSGAVLHFDSPRHEREPVEIYMDDI
jgi:hypothetical protein